jgi:hypothetical protein
VRTLRVTLVFLVVGCSSGNPGGGDDTIPGDDGGGGPLEDPAWPDDEPLPPELDYPPYLTLPAPTTVVVSWRTADPSTGTVRFGTSAALGSEVASPAAAELHHVELANLTPGAAYHYEVAIDGTAIVRKGVFVVPGRTSWRFMHSGELHAPSESANVAKYATAVREFRPHVVLESGDMVDDGDDLDHWRSYMRTTAPWISNVILLPAHSNHVNGSGGNANLLDIFVLPDLERWYQTRVGQVAFVSLDSTFNDNDDLETVEVPWLASTVAAAHDGVDDPTFVIGAWHHPACSSQYLSRFSERAWVNDNLVATFAANGGVDLILAAHDKYYERSTLRGSIVHVITNIGNVSPEIPGGNHMDCASVVTNRDTQSTALFTIDGATLSARVIDQTGAEIDAFQIVK